MSSPTFTYENLTTLQISELCSANHACLKSIIQTAPVEVQTAHAPLPRAVYKLLAIVLSLHESLQSGITGANDPSNLDNTDDRSRLEALLGMDVHEVKQLAQDDIAQLISSVRAALRADESLQHRNFSETDASSVTRLVTRWQLKATNAALERRDLAETTQINRALPAETEQLDELPPRKKRQNPMDASHDSGLEFKKQKVLRVAGVSTGEQDDEFQDFRLGLGGTAFIRPSQFKAYPGKTTILLNVQELIGPYILYSFCQEGINIELVVRHVRWPRQADGRPFSSEVEALTLARCLHFHFWCYSTMEEAIVTAPWTEIAMRRLWALLEVQSLTSGPCPLTREEAWQQVLTALEVYPDTGLRVPAMRSIVNRQVSAASRARNTVLSLIRRNQPQTQKNRKSHNDALGSRQELQRQ